ncbi:MAG TPA: hypothetical protein VFX19_10020 [Dehalococcoidia bacterium]|nr:hypothetical protein [Dehalococcoidia bacterium]
MLAAIKVRRVFGSDVASIQVTAIEVPSEVSDSVPVETVVSAR